MATIQISHDPSFDNAKLKELLRKEFAGRYEIIDNAHLIGFSGFMLKESAFIGATVEVKQEPGHTFVKVHPVVPSVFARLLGPIFLLLFRNQVIRDVEAFVGGATFGAAHPAH